MTPSAQAAVRATLATVPPILRHDDKVRLPTWVASYAQVFTVRGYARACGEDPAAAEARAIARGHALAATIYLGATLVNDGGAHHARQRQLAAAAIVLTEGEVYEIEGRLYRCRVIPGNGGTFPQNSDPIAWRPVAAAG